MHAMEEYRTFHYFGHTGCSDDDGEAETQTMRKEGITEALTNDHHFEQEGFRALFR